MYSLKSLKLFFLNKALRLLDHAGIGPDRELSNLEKIFSFSWSNNFPFIAIFNLNLPTVQLLGNLLHEYVKSALSNTLAERTRYLCLSAHVTILLTQHILTFFT